MRTYALVGVFVAPVVGVALGVWAEFADLEPPVLLAIALPAMAASLISAAYLGRLATRPLALVLLGGAYGLLTFSLAAGLYIAIHGLRGDGLDLNGADDGGSAGVFFVVHVVVGAIAGLVLGLAVGAGVAVVVWAARMMGRGAPRPIAPSREASAEGGQRSGLP